MNQQLCIILSPVHYNLQFSVSFVPYFLLILRGSAEQQLSILLAFLLYFSVPNTYHCLVFQHLLLHESAAMRSPRFLIVNFNMSNNSSFLPAFLFVFFIGQQLFILIAFSFINLQFPVRLTVLSFQTPSSSSRSISPPLFSSIHNNSSILFIETDLDLPWLLIPSVCLSFTQLVPRVKIIFIGCKINWRMPTTLYNTL